MSLRLWFPMNGNLKNQGIDNISLSGSPASYGTGKIGSCATFNGSTGNALVNSSTDYNYTDNFSFACWINPNYTGSTAQFIFTVGRADTGGWGYGLQVANATTVNVRFGSKTIAITCNSNTWYHVAMTVSNSTINVYLNGALAQSQAVATLPTYSDGAGLGIGVFRYNGGNIYPYYGSLNDFRIYDHALSAKEVKEISKALVCHYPLTGGGSAAANMLKNTNTANTGLFGYSEQTGGSDKVIEYDGGTPCIKVTRNSTAHSGWCYMWHNSLDHSLIKEGTTYTLSFDAIASGSGTIGFSGFMNGNATNQLSQSTEAIQSSFNSTSWSHIILRTTTKSSFEGLTVGSQVVYMGCGFMNSTGVWIKVKNFKVEEGSTATSWIPHTSDAAYTSMGFDNKEYDISGYGNHGTRSNVTLTSDSAKYNTSSVFNGTSSFVACGRGGMIKDDITINWFGYMDNWANYTRAISCTEGGGWNFEPSSSKMAFAIGTGTSSNTYKYATDTATLSTLAAGWHMFTSTYDGLNVKLYIDGVLKCNTAAYTTKTPIFYSGSNGIFIGAEAGGNQTTPAGSYFNGKISDVRIYGTALSADDIKELYQTSVSITNNGTVMCYEFNEQ